MVNVLLILNQKPKVYHKKYHNDSLCTYETVHWYQIIGL